MATDLRSGQKKLQNRTDWVELQNVFKSTFYQIFYLLIAMGLGFWSFTQMTSTLKLIKTIRRWLLVVAEQPGSSCSSFSVPFPPPPSEHPRLHPSPSPALVMLLNKTIHLSKMTRDHLFVRLGSQLTSSAGEIQTSIWCNRTKNRTQILEVLSHQRIEKMTEKNIREKSRKLLTV